MTIDVVAMTLNLGTWLSHHVLCLLLQPVHVVEFDTFLVLAARVVSLTHRRL